MHDRDDMAAKKSGAKSGAPAADAPTACLMKWMKRLVFIFFVYSVCSILDRIKVCVFSL